MTSLDFTKTPSGHETMSLWKQPGIDKETFYAAALYLHVAARGQLREPSLRTPRYQSKTDDKTKAFLDRIADCFARSKMMDPSAHVTATTMSKTEDARGNKILTVYITKNHSEKGLEPDLPPGDRQVIALNQNASFAKELFDWFNSMNRNATFSSSSESSQDIRRSHLKRIWRTLCEFNQSRLEYYIEKISDMRLDLLHTILADEPQGAWICAENVIVACIEYGRYTDKGPVEANLDRLALCASRAAECRSNILFSNLCQDAEALVQSNDVSDTTKRLVKFAKWINYLGRLGAACDTFYDYCTMEENHYATFEYVLLQSPDEEKWPAATYKSKIEFWTGDLGLDDDRAEREPVRAGLNRFVTGRAGQRGKARLHCEIQLLQYFSQPGAPPCFDYIGCSKKSCWLCWQLIGHFGKFTTKESHRMLYPMWAAPSEVLVSDTDMARAITATYNDIVALIQDKVHFNRDFSSRINITHTSERLSLRALGWNANEISSSLQPRLTGSLKLPGLHRFQSIPVVHLPAAKEQGHPPAPRVIKMEMFKIDPPNRWTAALKSLFIEDTECVFACQLETIPPSRDEELSLHEYQQHFWLLHYISFELDRSSEYVLLYRSDDIDLKPNPWITDAIMKAHSGVEEDTVPWRGDIYIIPIRTRNTSLSTTVPRFWPQWDPNPNTIDLSLPLSKLGTLISNPDAPEILATKKFDDLQESKDQWRDYNRNVNLQNISKKLFQSIYAEGLDTA